jgi:GntR family transcriptional regulator
MKTKAPSIRFRLDPRSGVAPYRQLVEQVREALIAGRLKPGDQLPPVREVVTQITINPNTVHRAYRELEHLGITEAQWGLGTFITAAPMPSDLPKDRLSLADKLSAWVSNARSAGLTDHEILDMVKKGLSKRVGVVS